MFLSVGVLFACAPTSAEDNAFQTASTTNGDFSMREVEMGDAPNILAVADLNGDGVLDVAAVNRLDQNLVIMTQQNGALTRAQSFQVGEDITGLIVADFDGGGESQLDMAVLNNKRFEVLLFLNSGSEWSEKQVDTLGFSYGMEAMDLDGLGGARDLVVVNTNANRLTTLVNDGQGGFSEVLTETPTAAGHFISGDWNGDGRPDLATTHVSGDVIGIFIGDGEGGFHTSQFDTREEPERITKGDFNEDGTEDLSVSGLRDESVSVFLGDGAGGFSEATGSPYRVTENPRRILSGRFSDDGLDLVTAHPSFGVINMLDGKGDGTFERIPITTGNGPFELGQGDFNVDGLSDLIVLERGNRLLSILHGTGSGLDSATKIGFDSTPTFPTTVDFNGDGKEDLLLLLPRKDRLVLLINQH